MTNLTFNLSAGSVSEITAAELEIEIQRTTLQAAFAIVKGNGASERARHCKESIVSFS